MQMKKVLVLISTKFVTYGGLTNAFMNYYRNMDKTDLIIDVASTLDADEVLIKEIECNGGKYIALPSKWKDPFKYIKAFKKISKGYDVVHINGNSSTMAVELYLAKKNNVPVRIAHCHSSFSTHSVMNFILNPLLNRSLTKALAVSEMSGKWLYKKDFEVLNNAINQEKYEYNSKARKELRAKLNISDNDILIGNVGKLNELKNQVFLLELLKRLNKSYKLIIVGGGPKENELKEKVDELSLTDSVIFTGMVNDAAKYYQAFDIFLFPSIYEGFGLALLEAEASGLPCIASTHVPKETNLSKEVKYLDLNIDKWVDEINKIDIQNKREEKSKINIKLIEDGGYGAEKNSEKLRKIYMGD